MRYGLYILLFALASCTASKRTSSTSVIESVQQSQQAKDSAQQVYKERIERDTVITLAYREVHDTVKQWQVAAGKQAQKPIYHEKTMNGLKAWVSIDTSGSVRYGASSDSFNLVVKGLVRERDSFKGLYRQQQFIHNTIHTSESRETVKTKQTVIGWMLNNAYWIVPVLILLYIIFSIIFKRLSLG